MELVDTLVLGTSAARREGSSPFAPTRNDALASFFKSHSQPCYIVNNITKRGGLEE